MSVVYMSWLTGVGCGPIVINFFIAHGYKPAFLLLIGMMIVVIIVALFLPGKRKSLEIEGREMPHTVKSAHSDRSDHRAKDSAVFRQGSELRCMQASCCTPPCSRKILRLGC